MPHVLSAIPEIKNSAIQEVRNSEIQEVKKSEIQHVRNSEIQLVKKTEIQKVVSLVLLYYVVFYDFCSAYRLCLASISGRKI